MSRTPIVATALAVAIGLVAAGCGSSNKQSSSSSSSTTTTSQTATTASGAGQAAAVTLKDFSVSNPGQLKAGKVTFTATNSGQTAHALVVDGPGVKDQGIDAAKAFGPGQKGTFTVTLQKGTYTLYCPVDGHKALGMKRTITVGSGGGSSSSGGSSGSNSSSGSGGGYGY